MSGDRRQTVAQIEHLALVTDDLERLSDFYLQLGPVAAPRWTDPDSGVRCCVLDFCGIRLELFERLANTETMTGEARARGLLRIGFALGSADAVDELSRLIAAAGHQVLEPPRRLGKLGRYQSVVLDPDGNRVELTV